MFTLSISYLITSNLPWFTDLTFQVPMQHCSLQHHTLLPLPVSPGKNWDFYLLWLFLFILSGVFLHSFPVAYWAPINLGSSSSSVLSFCLFTLFIGFSRQEYWSGLSFSSLVDHILPELSTMTRPTWVALQGMAHSFIELDKAHSSINNPSHAMPPTYKEKSTPAITLSMSHL